MFIICYLPSFALGYTIFTEIDRFFFSLFGISDIGRIIPMFIVLSLAFLWYMPAKYNHEFSFIKNVLHNGLGLISNMFKWTFISSMLMIPDLLQNTRELVATKALVFPLIISFIIVSVIIGILEIGRVAIKQFME